MADRKGKATLAEMMGSKAASGGGLSLKQLPEILGDAMPELPKNPVGRHRLIRALQQRFGNNFRALPGVKNLVKEFDNDVELEMKIARISAVKLRGMKNG
jgi:hypothetical protein